MHLEKHHGQMYVFSSRRGLQDSKQATQKRIESLKKADTSSPRRKPRAGALKPPGGEADARVPKKLSQVKVDPSIAKSLGGPSRGPSPAPSAASGPSQKQPTADVLDLFSDSDPAAPSAQPATVRPCLQIPVFLCIPYCLW